MLEEYVIFDRMFDAFYLILIGYEAYGCFYTKLTNNYILN